tara:strand:- start:2151 stop:2372 length:222 start_codon:yes stop_codon:yes gene_type:complete
LAEDVNPWNSWHLLELQMLDIEEYQKSPSIVLLVFDGLLLMGTALAASVLRTLRRKDELLENRACSRDRLRAH